MNIVGSGTVNGKIYGSATLGTLAPTTSGGIEIDLLNGGDSTTAFTGSEVATVQLVVRKDTSFNWGTNNPTLAEGEIAYSTDDKWFCIGDGVTEFNDLDDSHFYVNWLDILNFVNSQTSGLSTSIGNIQSDISTIQSNLESSNTFLSQLQEGLNDAVADISSLQSDVSSEASTRSTAVTSLQGQIIDINTSLADGLLKKFEAIFTSSNIASLSGSTIDLITPSSGKFLHIVSSCIISSGTKHSGIGFNATFFPSELISTFDFPDKGDYGLYPLQTNLNFTSFIQIEQPLQVLFANDMFDTGDTQIKLTIFYMEV